jgi:hypothetical protein
VRGHTSPGQRTEPQAGPAAWVVLAGKRERAEGPIHPFVVSDTDCLKKRQPIPARIGAFGDVPVACRGIVSRLAGRARGLGMNRAFSPCFFCQHYPGRWTGLRLGPLAWAGITPHLRCCLGSRLWDIVPRSFSRPFGTTSLCPGRFPALRAGLRSAVPSALRPGTKQCSRGAEEPMRIRPIFGIARAVPEYKAFRGVVLEPCILLNVSAAKCRNQRVRPKGRTLQEKRLFSSL